MSSSRDLLQDPIWSTSEETECPVSSDKIALHYERARSICRRNRLTLHDIVHLSPDSGISILIPSLLEIRRHTRLRRYISTFALLLNFDVCGQFLLTEVGHGLDVRSLETTATLQSDGSFDLHTPHAMAAKAMPPTTPACSMPKVGVVFARLMVDGEDRGIKPFIVWLCESGQMKRGITSRLLPTRLGTKPLDHSITTFDHVQLSRNSLLGSVQMPKDEKKAFHQHIGRVSVGTLALSISGISCIRLGTYIAAKYSQRRTTNLTDTGNAVPILTFSTQARPIINGWVEGTVLQSFSRWAVKMFMDPKLAPVVRHGIATVFKVTVIQASHILRELAERCGWQGLFAYNQILQMWLGFQGNSIAEGDTLVLSIRLGSELIGKRYQLPEPQDPSNKLARCEQELIAEASAKLEQLGGYQTHRSSEFNQYMLPRFRPMIEAMGHRMAFEAAKDEGVDPQILAIYENLCALRGSGYKTSNTWDDLIVKTYQSILPDMIRSLETSEERHYATAPILSSSSWDDFVQTLPCSKFLTSTDEGFQPKL